jgi:hypothetical protein
VDYSWVRYIIAKLARPRIGRSRDFNRPWSAQPD